MVALATRKDLSSIFWFQKIFCSFLREVTKLQEKNFRRLELSAKATGGGGGREYILPCPNRVKFGTSLNHPKWKQPFPQATHYEIYSSFVCINFQVLLVLEKLPVFSFKLRQKGLNYTHQQNVRQL